MSSPNDHALNRLLLSSKKTTLCYFLNTIKHTATGRLKSTNTLHVLSDVFHSEKQWRFNMGIAHASGMKLQKYLFQPVHYFLLVLL